jgi:hypothetical protein
MQILYINRYHINGLNTQALSYGRNGDQPRFVAIEIYMFFPGGRQIRDSGALLP